MYNPENKQFILKNSFGVSYHVYYESGRGLCLRMLSESFIWSRGYVLAANAVNDFSVTLDKDDFFHFVYQSKDGSIMYGHGRHGQIETQPILKSKDTTPWPKHLTLLICGDTVIVFYIVRYSDRHLISMQTIVNGAVSKPVAIDYVDGSELNYAVFLNNNKCHIIYTISKESQIHLAYREMKDDFSIFNAPKTIYSSDGNIQYPSVIVDSNNKTHILFQIHSDISHEILYRNFSSASAQILYKSKTSPGYSGLVFGSGVLYSYRVTDLGILSRNSSNGGKSWTYESAVPFDSSGELTCFIYHTNFKKERESFFSSELPGDFSHGYRLAFLNKEDNSPWIENMPKYDRKIAYESDSLMKDRHESQQQRVPKHTSVEVGSATSDPFSKIENKILQLQNITENMQRDLTKHWLRFKDFEKKLDKMSRMYRRYWSEDQGEAETDTDVVAAERAIEIEFDMEHKKEIDKDIEFKQGTEFERESAQEFEIDKENPPMTAD